MAGVGLSTVRDYEAGRREPQRASLQAMRTAIEDAGVEFTNGGQPGVRLCYIDVRAEKHRDVWHVLWRPAEGAPLQLILPTQALAMADRHDEAGNARLAAAMRNATQEAIRRTEADDGAGV